MSPDRIGAVWRALSAVTDPELDQSVVDLGFIARVAIEGGAVAVDYRLPTYWCSANFAWIMSEDMRGAVATLDWVTGVEVRLVDHFAAAKINAGVAAGVSFGSGFGSGLDLDLAALRQTFRRKAFLGRMSALIDALRQAGWNDAAILALSMADLTGLATARSDESRAADLTMSGTADLAASTAADPFASRTADPSASGTTEFAGAISRYLDLRRYYGGSAGSDDAAFRTLDGAPIAPSGLRSFLRDVRMTRRGAEANGEMCRMLLQARLYARPGQPDILSDHPRTGTTPVIPATAGTQ